MLGDDRQAVRDVTPELTALGFPDRLAGGEYDWADVDPLQAFGQLQAPGADDRESRINRWQMIGETAAPAAAIVFITTVLGSGLERESAAAAAALWRQIAPLAPRFPPGWLWRTWGRLFDLWELDWPDAWWSGAPFSALGPFGIDAEGDDVAAEPWEPRGMDAPLSTSHVAAR
jgi:hypothetical protein